MSKEYKNILTLEQCSNVANKMIQLKNDSKLHDETNESFYFNSLGIANLPEANEFLPQIESLINELCLNLKFENSYTRIYQKGSVLKYHTDREDLFLTLSVCNFSNVGYEWPIFVSNIPHIGLWNNDHPLEFYAHNCTQYTMPVGSGVTCFGTVFPHWRNPLICDDDQMVIQTFYHWNLQ